MEIVGDAKAAEAALGKAQDAVPPSPDVREAPVDGLGPKQEDGASSTQEKPLSSFEKAVVQSVVDTNKRIGPAKEDFPDKVDVKEYVESDPVLKQVGDMSGMSLSAAKKAIGESDRVRLITKEHREAFTDCLITGERYCEAFNNFGGKMRIVVRCRSSEETDAVDAYLSRKIRTGEVKTDSEYSHLARLVLIVAQIAEVNGVGYPEMAHPLKFSEDKDGIVPPAWEKDLEVWANKPDVIISALAGAILEFEARYWYMVSKASDTNFWTPGESTGV